MHNLTMMTDLYELTMMNGYLRHGMKDARACFDVFYRKQGDLSLIHIWTLPTTCQV